MPTKVGEQVWCADYDDEQRIDCYTNGQCVLEFTDHNTRARVDDSGRTHRIACLTTVEGEIYSIEELDDAMMAINERAMQQIQSEHPVS